MRHIEVPGRHRRHRLKALARLLRWRYYGPDR